MKLKTLIAEEQRTHAYLRRLCAARPELDVVAQVDCGTAAVDAIESSRPDLLLLDAELPDMTGAEVLRTANALDELFTVWVTNREQLRHNLVHSDGFGYLSKPVTRSKFDALIDTALTRSIVARERPQEFPSAFGRVTQSSQLIGERAHRFYFLDAVGIDYLEVEGNYVTIHSRGEKYLTRSTLKHLCELLVPQGFVRIARSMLVNLRQVEYVERQEGGQFMFRMRQGSELVSSRERSSEITRLLRGGVHKGFL